jgi:hypothetical protein
MRGIHRIGPAFCLAGVLTTGCIIWQSAHAEDEFRVGLMFQIPFGGSHGGSFIHLDDTRIGAKVQYAAIDDITLQREKVIDRVFIDGILQNETVKSDKTVTLNDGDKVSGAEAYLLVTPFNRRWNLSGGVNGFTGNRDFQGALGFGIDPSIGVYTQLGVLMPFSEVGVRFNFHAFDFFAGMTSLDGFSSKTVWKDDVITYNDSFHTTPKPADSDAAGSAAAAGVVPPTGKI